MSWEACQVLGFAGTPRVQQVLNPNDMDMQSKEWSLDSESDSKSSVDDVE